MANKPAVLQIIPNLESGGAEKTTVDVAKALVDSGWSSFVVSQGGQMVETLEQQGTTHIKLPAASKNPAIILANALRLMRIIRDHKISIVHTRSRAPAWSSLIAARKCDIPFVTTFHGAYTQKSWLKELYNSVMVRSDIVIANSQWTAGLIQERTGLPMKTIEVVYPGTDFSSFDKNSISNARRQTLQKDWNINNGQKIILMLARITALKGHKTLIRAIPEVLKFHPDVIFVMAGGDHGHSGYRAELEKLADSLGIAGNVRFPGYCDDPSAAYAVADISIVASHQPETFGRAAIEAQALQTPVIVTNIGAVGETVLTPPAVREDERTGWKIPPNDPTALSEAINTVLASRSFDMEAVSNRARAHVVSAFSTERMCADSLKVYASALGAVHKPECE